MILDRILHQKRIEIEAERLREPLDDLKQKVKDLSPTRLFFDELKASAETGVAIIAEVKKGSPSKGIIRADFDPEKIARGYQKGGATCLSVLTDQQFFFGHLDYLAAIRQQVALPLLRKDFILDPYQIYQARAYGADAILLIAAALETDEMVEFVDLAHSLELDVLLEVHDEEELERSLATAASMIGINNRNLKTFETDLSTTERLAPWVPVERLIVAESGLQQATDIARLKRAGAKAFLIGESLMRESDFSAKLRALQQL